MKAVAYIDGSCLGNPGDAAYAIILQDESGGELKAVGRYIGKATNNIAEFSGLLGCLELAEQLHINMITIYSDSQLLVKQLSGEYRIKQPHLQKIHNRIHETAEKADISYEVVHIGREQNKQADRLARQSARIKKDIL